MDMKVSDSISNGTYKETIVPFKSGDGLVLNLINIQKDNHTPTKEPVLLVHGAGVRANIFHAPVSETIIDALVSAGYDVWLENWRASIDITPNQWTLDQAALYDHPYAIKKIVECTGRNEIKAIIHCQGSTSFTVSALCGLIPEVKTIVSNAVSLHPVVPTLAGIKLKLLTPIIKHFTSYIDPQWGIEAPNFVAKLALWFVLATHHECKNNVCRMASFTYGAGFPTLWRHENLNDETHEWLINEFKSVPITFFSQMKQCVNKGHLVRYDEISQLPNDYTQFKPKTSARFAFICGEQNHCFLPQSQENTFAYFSSFKNNYHSLHVIPNYGHLDIFMGQSAAKDVFPTILKELET